MRALAAGTFHAIPGKSYATPKELWGFQSERGTGTPRGIAWDFLSANRELLGITSEWIASTCGACSTAWAPIT